MKVLVRTCLAILAFSFSAILIVSLIKSSGNVHTGDCLDGKCYPKKAAK